ncbi:MAG TPA: diacylglycerol kinase family protein, partial [Saprospiraceae bacterium]|nr:diacylglycerol kinase family protein [Saprospiraceae bacterium]
MSIRRRIASFRYAFQGLGDLFRSQVNARIHLAAVVVVAGAGIYFHISAMEWVALVLCMSGVIALEALNTALEYLTDLVSPDPHPLAGKAKDVAAAAVLIMALGAV